MENYRLIAVLQVFNIILVMKAISATYFATKYALEQQLVLLEYYTNLLKIVPIFLLISLISISIPLIWQVDIKIKKYLDYIALIIIFVGMIILFF